MFAEHRKQPRYSAAGSMNHILITGGAGFIGSHLTEACLLDGDDVTVLDNLSTGRMENLQTVSTNRRFHFVEGDIQDAALLDRLICKCDLVYHLAGAVGVRKVIASPLQTLATNFLGTKNVFDACAQHGRKVVFASTSEVYGKSVKPTFLESDDLLLGNTSVGRWGYACAKALDEFLAFAEAKERALRFVILRYFNTIGPRQLPDHGMVVPRLLGQAAGNEPLTVFGDGSASRCFMHVADAVEATRLLAACPGAEQQVVNVGNPEPITILELARRIISLTGSRSTIQHVDPRKIYDADFEDMATRVPDITRLQKLTRFSPRRNLENAIRDCFQHLPRRT